MANNRREVNPLFEALHGRHSALVSKLIWYWRVPRVDQMDLAHVIWTTVFVEYEEGVINDEQAWVARIVRNCVFTYRRRRTLEHKVMTGFTDEVREPNGDSRDSKEVWLVRAAFDRMSDEERDILIQVALAGIELQDYAREAGIHRHTAEKRYHAAEKRFRAIVDGIRAREGLSCSVVLGPALFAKIPSSEVGLSEQEHEAVFRRAAETAECIRAARRPVPVSGRWLHGSLGRWLGRGIASAVLFTSGFLAGRSHPPTPPPPSPALAGLRGQIAATLRALPAPSVAPPAASDEAPGMPPVPAQSAGPSGIVAVSSSHAFGAHDEMTLLRGADVAREGGRCDDAEALLDTHQKEFPSGRFASLREALRVRIREARRGSPPGCRVAP